MSEIVASKVCPVCKTFISSSNTTLNVHIDQCLSVETTTKQTANIKVIKHRIEPRKFRSMVDIYATANYCTLEELDRRNGTNWASSWSLPAQRIETHAQGRNQKAPDDFENSENEVSVYADGGGKKLILSKFGDLSSSSQNIENPRPRRQMKGHQDSKFFTISRKKIKQGKKLHKLPKSIHDSKKFCSLRPHRKSEIISAQETNSASEEICVVKGTFTQRPKTHDRVKFNDSRTVVQWVCSSRTALEKKKNGKDYLRLSECTEEKELQGGNNESYHGNSHLKRGHLPRSTKSSGHLPPYPKIKMNMSFEPDIEYGEELYLEKRGRVSLLDSRACNDQSSFLLLSEGNVKDFRDAKNGDRNIKANPISSLSGQRVAMKRARTRNADKCNVNSKQSSNAHAFSSKSKRFSSLRQDNLSIHQASLPEPNFISERKHRTLKKPRVFHASESDEWNKVKARGEETCVDAIVHPTTVLKVRKGELKISRKEEKMVPHGSMAASENNEHGDDFNFVSFPGNVSAGAFNYKESVVKEVQLCGKDIVSGPGSDMIDEEASTSKSSDVEFHDVTGCSDVQSDLRQFVEIKHGPSLGTEDSRILIEPTLSGNQEMFCTDEGETNIGKNVYMRIELDSKDRPDNNYDQIDPMLISGIQGSFLHSPGSMASEEIQGNSSMTSQLQSSKAHPELIDRDSSNSPSSTSTISNSDMGKFDSRFAQKLALGPNNVQDGIRSSIYDASNVLVDNSTPDPNAEYDGTERLSSSEPTVNMMFRERGPLRFKSDQPCCCSLKEGPIPRAAALDYQESPVLQRGIVSLISQPANDKQMNGYTNRKLGSCYLIPEMLSSCNLTRTQNVTTYPLGHILQKVFASSEDQFPFTNAGESATPSKSNSVLRLMGKDIMVVNKDDDMSQ